MYEGRVETADHDARDVRLGRVLDDFLSRRSRGERITEDDLVAQHPDLADDLREMLAMVRDLRPGTDRIDSLIGKGILDRCADPRYLAELGAYKIAGYIGSGGMGVVLRAYEEDLDRTVALKILRPELTNDPVGLARFQREAKAAAALRHPNVVTIHAVGEHQGVHYLAMEYMPGGSLADLIRQPSAASYQPSTISDQRSAVSNQRSARSGPRPRAADETAGVPSIPNRQSPIVNPQTIREIFRQLLSALGAAHAAGLIHRDVKSSNILLDEGIQGLRDRGIKGPSVAADVSPAEDVASGLCAGRDVASGLCTGRDVASGLCTGQATTPPASPESPTVNRQSPIVKLADFGLARMLSAQTRVTRPDSILGTPEYMSPEQARGDDDIDHRTDLYSAGVVLYEMLTGRTPFRADTPSAVIHQILNTDPPAPRTFNKNVEPVLASLALRLMAKQPEDRLASAGEALEVLGGERRVCLLEQQRPVRLWVTIVAAAVALLLVGTWALTSFGIRLGRDIPPTETARRIVDVWVEKRDGKLTTRIMAIYDDGLGEQVFHTFPRQVDVVNAATPVNCDGRGDKIAVAGLERGLDDGSNVVAFDARGKELWRRRLSNHHLVKKWPDCNTSVEWACRLLVAGDLDRQPGEELLVVANDPGECPSRVSVVDPRTGEIRSTFWHMGQFTRVLTCPDFLGPGRPAVIAWGSNNKLDGFDNAWPGAAASYTDCCDVVDVIAVLEPNNMDGLGPPQVDPNRLPIDPVVPYAYAFLDWPQTVPNMLEVPEGQREADPSAVPGALCIRDIAVLRAAADGGEFVLRISVGRRGRSRSESHGWTFELSQNLELKRVTAVDGETFRPPKGYWDTRWRPIIQNGEYVAE